MQFFFIFQKNSNQEKFKGSGFFFCCKNSELQKYRDVFFSSVDMCKLEKEKELVEMELAADTQSDAYEEDSRVEVDGSRGRTAERTEEEC